MTTDTAVERVELEEILRLGRLSDLPGVGRAVRSLPQATDAEWHECMARWDARMSRIEALTGWPSAAILRIEMLEDQLEQATERAAFEAARADRLAAIA